MIEGAALAEPERAHFNLLRDSIALVTAQLPVTDCSSDVIPARLADQEPGRQLGLTVRTA